MSKKISRLLLSASVAAGIAFNTGLALANPFADVPSDHWSYDALSQLAANGIIEGYGDNTFRGNQNVTRYEVAKMTAAAMAKINGRVDDSGKPVMGEGISRADKALVDRLAAEFSDELVSLGVRVSELERNSDFVKWTGELRYMYRSDRTENTNGSKQKNNLNRLELRLFPTAEINDKWHFKTRITGRDNLATDSTTDLTVTYAYAEGKYKNFTLNLGKMSNYSTNDDGLVTDDFFSGAQVVFGKKLQTVLEAGRWNMARGNGVGANFAADTTANYQGLQLNYGAGKGFIGLGYRRFSSDGFRTVTSYSNNNSEDTASIFSVGGSYRFGSSVTLSGAYAKNTDADFLSSSHSVKLAYKGANRNKPKTWGVWTAYRYVSPNVSFGPTFETMGLKNNRKGVEFGVNFAPAKRIMADAAYFDGKDLSTHRDSKTVFGRVRWYF